MTFELQGVKWNQNQLSKGVAKNKLKKKKKRKYTILVERIMYWNIH